MTNYDRIRNMSVEEMAKFLAIESVRPIVHIFETDEDAEEFFNQVFAKRKQWLESEVTE